MSHPPRRVRERSGTLVQAGVGVGAAIALAGCSGEPQERWEGFVHPDSSRAEVYDYAGTHRSLRACLDMGYAFLDLYDALDRGHYECGKNCGWTWVAGRPQKRCEAIAREDREGGLRYLPVGRS